MPPLTQTDANNMSLKDLSVAMAGNNEGQQASQRIKAAREARDQGMSAAQARQVARGVEPTVSAQQLAEPPQRVTVPETPEAPGIPPATNAGIRSTFLDLQRTAQGARQLQQRQQELADLGVVSSFDLSQQLEREYGVTPERLGQLERLENELAAMDAESAERKARRLTAPGGTAAGARAAISREDVELAVRSANTAAQAEVLRGNIDLARERVRDAVTLATQDRQFQSNLLINQINQLQGQVDAETQAALEDEKRQFEASQARIEEIKTAVDAAINSGATSQQEMAALTAISQPQQPNETVQQYLERMEREDAQKLALAQSIVGRGATEERDLEISAQNALISQRNASAASAWLEYEMLQDAKADMEKAIESGEITPEQAETIDSIDKQFRSEPIVKAYNEAVANRFAFEAIVNEGVQGVTDIRLVYDFMKSVDPTSVVRETEFDTAANAGNIFQGTYAKFNGMFTTGEVLPDDVRQAFLSSVNAAFNGREQQYMNVKSQFGEKVNRRLGIEDGKQYLTAYEASAPFNESDIEVVDSMSGASEQDIQDIMMLTQELLLQPPSGTSEVNAQ